MISEPSSGPRLRQCWQPVLCERFKGTVPLKLGRFGVNALLESTQYGAGNGIVS